MKEFEELKYIGSFGLVCSISFDYIEHQFGDGYDETLVVGSSTGLREWQLKYKVLPGTLDRPIQLDNGDLLSRADYLWDLFNRLKADGNKSLIITCPRDGKRYLAKIVEPKLSYEMFMVKLFSSGLTLRQRRERGVATLDDGSLGDLEPDI